MCKNNSSVHVRLDLLPLLMHVPKIHGKRFWGLLKNIFSETKGERSRAATPILT